MPGSLRGVVRILLHVNTTAHAVRDSSHVYLRDGGSAAPGMGV